VELGRIGAPFGLEGWVRVSSFTEPAEALLGYGEWLVHRSGGERMRHRVLEGRVQSARVVVRLEGVTDRDAAAALTGAMVEVERTKLPPTGDREYYRADLIGFAVRNLEGVALGVLKYFVDAPAGAVMVIEERPGREHWVLADPAHLRRVDREEGRILVDWPAELE
jgi:16S rRNA processing protein RimM